MRSLLLSLSLLVAVPVSAQTPAMNAARAAGQIGERYDGYVGVVGQVSAIVRSQVASVNIQRRSLYSNLAATRGVSPADVGITAACQLLARVGEGEAFLWNDGVWRRRTPGQSAVPSYCR